MAAMATVLAANKKVREVEIVYEQKIRESYLENARSYTQAVYVPIAVELTKLRSAFDKFRVEGGERSNDELAMKGMQKSMTQFTGAVGALLERGASAFLTTTLERELEDFVAFIAASQTATSTLQQAVVRYDLLGFGVEGTIQSSYLIRQARLLQTATSSH